MKRLILGVVMVLCLGVGCLLSGCAGGNPTAPASSESSLVTLPSGDPGYARIRLGLRLGGDSRVMPEGAIRALASDPIAISVCLTSIFRGNASNPTIVATYTATANASRTAVLDISVPAVPTVAEVHVPSGAMGAYAGFRGALDLVVGTNTLTVHPIGSGLRQDVVAHTVLALVASPAVFAMAPSRLVESVVGVVASQTRQPDVNTTYANAVGAGRSAWLGTGGSTIASGSLRFSRGADGIISDRQTNLQWLEGDDFPMGWYVAKAWVDSLGKGWRLPTVAELQGLYIASSSRQGATYTTVDPLGETQTMGPYPLNLDPAFQRNSGYSIWSELASETESVTESAFYFAFRDGGFASIGPCTRLTAGWGTRALAVRSPNPDGSFSNASPTARFVQDSRGIIRDLRAGLEWYHDDTARSWHNTKTWAEGLAVGGGGWRMPTVIEVQNLRPEGMPSHLFTSSYIWTSAMAVVDDPMTTTFDESQAWAVRFYDADTPRSVSLTSTMAAMAVRTAP